MSLPLNIPSIIGQIVADTATAMGINIAYKHGTWNHIRERITTEQGGLTPNAVFPMIALVQVFEEKFKDDSEFSEARLTLLICNNSQPDWYSEDRYTKNYLPTLYPIYAELMEQINQSQYVTGYVERYHEHTKIDDLHLPENNQNKLPECLDGLWIQDLKLNFILPPCSNVVPNYCAQTPCPNGAELDYMTAITGVAYTHSQSQLGISVTHVGTGTLTYTLQPNGGVVVGNVLNVSGSSDGSYVCRIKYGTALHEFYYEVKGGKFEHYPLSFSNALNVNTNCYNYVVNGGYRLAYSYSSDYHNINSTGFLSQINGNTIVSDSFVSKPYTNTSSGTFQDLNVVTLTLSLTLQNGIVVQNISQIKLKCS